MLCARKALYACGVHSSRLWAVRGKTVNNCHPAMVVSHIGRGPDAVVTRQRRTRRHILLPLASVRWFLSTGMATTTSCRVRFHFCLKSLNCAVAVPQRTRSRAQHSHSRDARPEAGVSSIRRATLAELPEGRW